MNWVGLRTLLVKEIKRFARVPGQTLASPLITTSLYFVVFGYALGAERPQVLGTDYLHFIVPGLVFLGAANNAFLNSSSSLFITKVQGTVVDLLVAPLSPLELLLGFIGGGVVRGVAVGGLTWLVAALLAHPPIQDPAGAVGLLLGVSYVFSCLGLLAGLWAEKFEQINFFPTFVMLPLTFLGGVFYSIDALPTGLRRLSLLNPMVFMVDALRHTMVARSHFGPWPGVAMLAALGGAGTLLAHRLLRSGYKLKS